MIHPNLTYKAAHLNHEIRVFSWWKFNGVRSNTRLQCSNNAHRTNRAGIRFLAQRASRCPFENKFKLDSSSGCRGSNELSPAEWHDPGNRLVRGSLERLFISCRETSNGPSSCASTPGNNAQQHNQDHRRSADYFAQVGDVIRALREDVPNLIDKSPDCEFKCHKPEPERLIARKSHADMI